MAIVVTNYTKNALEISSVNILPGGRMRHGLTRSKRASYRMRIKDVESLRTLRKMAARGTASGADRGARERCRLRYTAGVESTWESALGWRT